ncbi:hypothetical protein Airi01_006550 [Actinoallomurus iriomotensis]|uniref:Protein kinase domain-containing protein n=2 Tax=Actinoallomurus iriomotensis TaxID=478107 RepID=A0A9W6RB51_9ACTN|nr:hypothetical protein Airi01_006550 [Actinoallomurus iriomotensis]
MTMRPLRPEDPREIGSYRLVGRLGGGGMGQVFLGHSPGGRPVAVKVLLPGLAADDGFRRRFGQEVEAARRVGGFHTAPLVDADPTADPPWLVTAYIPGPSLREAVEAHGPLPPRSVLALGAGLAEGLAAIHACGLVHRDLKPGNVILAVDGPRIIDFGIARAMDAAAITATGSLLGTPGFMSPEQIHGSGDLGPASDVFALGSVLTFAATGRGPFDGGSTASIGYRILHTEPDLGTLSSPVRELVAGCLAKDPAARPLVADVLRELSASADRPGGWLPPAVTTMVAERNAPLNGDAPSGPGARADGPVADRGTLEWTPPGHGDEGQRPLWPSESAQWRQQPPPPYPTWPGGAPSRGAGPVRAIVVAGAALALLAVVGIVAFATTRDTDGSGGRRKNVTGTASPSAPGVPALSPGTAAAVAGNWRGTYTCLQGVTDLELVIRPVTTDGGLEATFSFSAHPGNPSVPSGSYAMQGTFVSRDLELRGVRWIERPGDYLMVGLSADVPEDHPSRIRGRVVSETAGCTTFSVDRE